MINKSSLPDQKWCPNCQYYKLQPPHLNQITFLQNEIQETHNGMACMYAKKTYEVDAIDYCIVNNLELFM
jgi:hypothetical protein